MIFKKLTGYIIWFFIIFLSIGLFRNIGRMMKVKEDISAEKDKITKIQKENDKLQAELLESQKPEFIEKEIRDKLGLVKTGETVVVLPDEEILEKLAPQPQKDEESLPDPNWRRWLNLFL
jgi:cell division protein FtsB